MQLPPHWFGKAPSASAPAHGTLPPEERPALRWRPAAAGRAAAAYPDNEPELEFDPYAVLGLPAGSPVEDVRAQYRLLAKRHHPDLKGGGHFWQEHFKKINVAYDFLTDPARKAAYDQRQTVAPQIVRQAPPMAF